MVSAFRWGAVPKKEGEGKSKEKKKVETNGKRVHDGARRKRHGRNEVTS